MATVATKPEIRQQGSFRRELLPNARAFYKRELGPLGRPNKKGWAVVLAGCPFHPSESKRSFFVNIITGASFCHGCGAKGDMVGFVMRRYGLKFWDAAKYLNAIDGDVTPGHRAEVLAAQRKLEQQRAEQEANHRKRIETRDLLHNLERHAKLASVRLWNKQLGPKGADVESEWELLELLTDAIAETEAEYFDLSGLESER